MEVNGKPGNIDLECDRTVNTAFEISAISTFVEPRAKLDGVVSATPCQLVQAFRFVVPKFTERNLRFLLTQQQRR